MTISKSQIASVINMAWAELPDARFKIRYGATGDNEVDAVQVMATQNDGRYDLDGESIMVRGTLIVKVADCAPWDPPATGDTITVLTYAGEKVGDFYILAAPVDPTDTFFRIVYGEATA